MEGHKIAVFTGRQDLLRFLREMCPEHPFEEGSEPVAGGTSVAIFDEDSETGLTRLAGRDLVCISLLSREATGSPSTTADFSVDRRTFIAHPITFLDAAVQLAAAREQLREAREQAQSYLHLQDLLGVSDTHVLSERITRKVLETLGLPYGTMLLHDPKIERFVTTFTDYPEQMEAGDFLPGVGAAALKEAISSATGFSVEPPRGDSDGQLLLPILVEQDLIGVIKVSIPPHTEIDPARSARAVRYLRTVTPILANAYQLSRSRELSLRDDLTRAFNRRFFEAYLEEEMERARRYRSVLSIIFLDLDDLKLVNNAHGHMAGSRTLQEVARRIMGAVRTIDKVVRFGGDEFCVILPQTDHEQATAVAARIRDALVCRPVQLDPEVEVRITASFGIASYPLHANTKEDLISAADAAMLLVKSTTKDEIGVARAAPPSRFADLSEH
jgi:diguanylate cyclase (GGDEF)-like protein